MRALVSKKLPGIALVPVELEVGRKTSSLGGRTTWLRLRVITVERVMATPAAYSNGDIHS
jgi:hypothetical protein